MFHLSIRFINYSMYKFDIFYFVRKNSVLKSAFFTNKKCLFLLEIKHFKNAFIFFARTTFFWSYYTFFIFIRSSIKLSIAIKLRPWSPYFYNLEWENWSRIVNWKRDIFFNIVNWLINIFDILNWFIGN